jgi:hypothetical protein
MRVQIPAYTDRWMMGDRYGEVTSTYLKKTDGRRVAPNTVIAGPRVEIARVKLDISKKTIRVLLADCTVV